MIPNWITVDVDVAVSISENRVVVAAICRSPNGEYLGSSALACPGISDPATLETIVRREALSLAANLHITKSVFDTDCLEVIKSLKSRCLPRYVLVLR
jgi:hypothetical protein